ncbi:MAG: hypothetical protein B6V02_00780 [Thermoprotei archaeon ex4572_64]|nr:MAG: hypothetical protein B6V02_00780 [Thermoprotei archaeon ex4572_64]
MVELFRSRGFKRLKCRVCGSYFWSIRERETCGDQPCTSYEFINSSPVKRSVESLGELRERYLNFFEKYGHTRVKPYPVVASRWRSDVYLVGASIYVFQPWVTSGVVPPPANPLVISQPCIRLTDIDIVGKSGRHLTSFEMMAHHAFNYPEKTIYWTDKTVELAHKFFTEELGIDEEEITYKESWWEGGGNAGECFEVLVRGLEVATLVFMHYKASNGRYEDMSIKIVDTGYGLERMYWLCRGDANIYEAIYKDFISRAREKLGIESPDPKVLREITEIYAKNREVTLSTYENLARKLGIDYNYLIKTVKECEVVYTLADHCKSIEWLIRDGVLPSNAGIGYIARLLIRRILRSLYTLNIDIPLVELFSLHIDYVSREYPELKECRDTILEVIDYEYRKFKELMSEAPQIISKIVKDRERRSGRKVLTSEDLVLLYDSHGIPPEITQQVCKSKFNIDVKVPENFYTELALRHKPVEEVESEYRLPISEEVLRSLPKTEELFYKHPFQFQFRARVLKIINDKYVVLEHYKVPSLEEIRKIEELANTVIQQNLPVSTEFLVRSEAESRYGVRIYQGGFIPSPIVRIVKIGKDENIFDVQACGGTHLDNTGKIGLLKIVKVEKIQEGIIRFIFTTGKYALEYVGKLECELEAISKMLKASRDEITKQVKELINVKNILESKVKKLMRRLAQVEGEKLISKALKFKNYIVTYVEYSGEESEYIQELARYVTSSYGNSILIVINKTSQGYEYYTYLGNEVADKVSAKELINVINMNVQGRGGGSKTYGRGFTHMKVELSSIVDMVINYLKSR